MISAKNFILMYRDGFKNMKVGKTLWKLIFIKLAVIFLFLNYVVHDKSINTEYKSFDQKVDFVHNNIIGKGN